MGSRGSVIPIFLKNKNKIFHITDNRMTRFNITLEEGVFFVIKSLQRMFGGEIFVPKIPSYNIIDIPKAIVRNPKFNFIGIRPGEKLHEEMISTFDAANTVEFEKHYEILTSKLLKKYKGKKNNFVNKDFSYRSDNNKFFLNKNDLKKIISSFNFK
jgi:FlaA1/EpsC-like NDP-sugar epimerase